MELYLFSTPSDRSTKKDSDFIQACLNSKFKSSNIWSNSVARLRERRQLKTCALAFVNILSSSRCGICSNFILSRCARARGRPRAPRARRGFRSSDSCCGHHSEAVPHKKRFNTENTETEKRR